MWDHAPKLWLSEDDDGFWPGSLTDFFNQTEGIYHFDKEHNEMRLMLQTRIPLTNPYDNTQAFLHGERPVNGKSYPVHTFLLPVEPEQPNSDGMDALEMLLNPEESVIEAAYVYWFPYDFTPAGLGFHVGDIEKTKVQFDKGVPIKVRNSYHAWEKDHDWHDIIRMGGHPNVFNARGTHATYIDQGIHLFDYTDMKEPWDLWRDLDMIFPWDWNSDKRVVHTDSNLEGVNYLTQVWTWGNPG